jgi:hypothetical protein
MADNCCQRLEYTAQAPAILQLAVRGSISFSPLLVSFRQKKKIALQLSRQTCIH